MRPSFEILGEIGVLSEEKAGFGAVETPSGRLPLKAMDLSGRVTGLHFRNRLVQTFVNAFSEPLEATYIFPMPDRAAVVSFKMRVADRVIDGVLKEREEARLEYDQAIAQGHQAAIAEEERADVFTMRAGNIMPGQALTVELELSGPLQFSDGEATFRFPLVVAPRYIPGTPLEGESVGSGTALDTDAVPDASRITPPLLLPGQPNPVFLTMALEVDPAGLPLQDLRSSLHDLVVEELGEGALRLSLRPGVERLDRDLILRFTCEEEALASSLRVLPDAEGEGSTFALTLVPPGLKRCNLPPRDVVVVLDRSGSMEGWKMVAARRAAARIVDSLTVHDRFAVLLFDSVLEEPFETGGSLVEATDRDRFRAVEFLARVEARGGTEIGPALARSLDYFGNGPSEGRERVVVFVTDGQVGNEAQVLELASGRARKLGVRLHTVGIDRSVNVSFLSELASRSGGMFDLVESEERLDRILQQIHRRIGHPLLCEVELQIPGREALELTPERADVFPGVPLVLSGRLEGAFPPVVTVVARQPDGNRWTKKLKVERTEEPVLRQVWARARVLDLQHQLDTGRADLGALITAFSLRWGVLCRFTAFVAVDHSQVVNPGGQVHQVTQAVETPSGWAKAKKREMPARTMQLAAPCVAPARAMLDGLLARDMPKPAGPAPTQAGGWLGGGSTDRLHNRAFESSSPPPAPEEMLKKRLPMLEKSLAAWKKKPADNLQPVLDCCAMLVMWGGEKATKLAEQGRQAVQTWTSDAEAGLKLLESWLEALAELLGVKKRKSWWKR